jgi:hypothetical protein
MECIVELNPCQETYYIELAGHIDGLVETVHIIHIHRHSGGLIS